MVKIKGFRLEPIDDDPNERIKSESTYTLYFQNYLLYAGTYKECLHYTDQQKPLLMSDILGFVVTFNN